MAHYYGKVQGTKGTGSRLGTKTSGMETIAASWEGAVKVTLYHKEGHDYACVKLIPWEGQGVTKLLYEGRVDNSPIKD